VKKVFFVILVSIFSIRPCLADVSPYPCNKEISAIVKEGFASFPRMKPENLAVGEKPELIRFNGKEILSYMTSLDLTFLQENLSTPHAYNFYFDPKTCKFINGVALGMENSPSRFLKTVPRNCKPTEVLENINKIVESIKTQGEISDLQYSYRVDDAIAMMQTGSFAVFNLMKINGEVHVLSTYFNSKSCMEVHHYLSKQIPYSR
jgi:hypothetical protein